jgi:hypothetical protein
MAATPVEPSDAIAFHRWLNRNTPSATAGGDAAGMALPADGEGCASAKWAVPIPGRISWCCQARRREIAFPIFDRWKRDS